MYEQHFGLTARPFSIAPDPRFLYMSRRHREALAHLLYGVGQGGGFVQLTGEVGTGKTTICRCLLEQVPDHVDVALILNPRVNAVELLASLCDELGIRYAADTTSLKTLTDLLNAHLLEAHARGRRTVLIIDEAQNLDPDALEQVRLLTNLETTREKLLQIVLIGQPELRELLAREDLRQLAQRITARYHLEPIAREETAAYIRHRLQVCGAAADLFTEGAIDRVQQISGGVPRLINVLCDRAMLGAFVENQRQVDAGIVDRAAREVLPEEGLRPPARNWRWWAAAALAAFALAFGFGYWQSRTVDPSLQVQSSPAGADMPVGGPLTQTPPDGAGAFATSGGTGAMDSASVTVAPARAGLPAESARTAAIAPVDTAAVTPVAAAPDPPQDLGIRLVQAGPQAAARAWQGLYRLWGVDLAPLGDDQACAVAADVGLRCLLGGGSRAVLAYFDRPAILLLTVAGGRRVPVLLYGLKGDTARVELDGVRMDVPMSELERYWFGEYRLLWRTPPGGSTVLRPGDRHPDVRWLRERLGRLLGQRAVAPDPAHFGQGLKQLVQLFQQQQQLDADGVVGARTFIHINNLLHEGRLPRLSEGGRG